MDFIFVKILLTYLVIILLMIVGIVKSMAAENMIKTIMTVKFLFPK